MRMEKENETSSMKVLFAMRIPVLLEALYFQRFPDLSINEYELPINKSPSILEITFKPIQRRVLRTKT